MLQILNARKQRDYWQFDLYLSQHVILFRLRFYPKSEEIGVQRYWWARQRKWLDVYQISPKLKARILALCKEKWGNAA